MPTIYKFVSPSGKVYIGQTWNLTKRLYYYKHPKNCREQPGISRSIKKYGLDAHTLEVLHELPSDTEQLILDEYEKLYIAQYKDTGHVMLNMTEGGLGGKMSPESVAKIKAKRSLQIPPTLGKKFSEETKKKISAAHKGRKLSPERRERMKGQGRGRKFTDEQRRKLRDAKQRFNHWIGKKHTEESRRKQSLAKIGHKINNKKVKRLDTGEIFDSLIDAAQSIGLSAAALSSRLRRGTKKAPFFTYDV